MRIALTLIALAISMPINAQSVTLGGDVAFNPLSVGEADVSNIYNIDASFADTYGAEVPAPLRLLVPEHDGLHVRALAVPDGGALMAFVFSQDGATPDDRLYLEDIQVTGAVIPMFPDSADPIHERRVIAAQLLEQDVFPRMTAGFERAEIFAIEAIELGNVPGALQLVAGYYDPTFDDNMMLRAVILPHPNQAESYMAMATINLDLVPVTNAETLAATMTGRVLSSWLYQ